MEKNLPQTVLDAQAAILSWYAANQCVDALIFATNKFAIHKQDDYVAFCTLQLKVYRTLELYDRNGLPFELQPYNDLEEIFQIYESSMVTDYWIKMINFLAEIGPAERSEIQHEYLNIIEIFSKMVTVSREYEISVINQLLDKLNTDTPT